MSDALLDRVTWTSYPVPATIASPNVGLSIGTVGSGGPVGLLVAGQHGDEGPWGTRAIARFLQATPADALAGTLRVVPVANPLAYEENSRTAHIDGDDVNMEFPGDAQGKHTPRLAAVLREHAVDGANVVLDVHGGGSWVGTIVAAGTEIGRLVDPLTLRTVETYRAPYDQTALMLLRPTIAVMEGGEMVCVVASP